MGRLAVQTRFPECSRCWKGAGLESAYGGEGPAMSDELKRLVELAQRQEDREISRSRYWRNVRWMLIVIIALTYAFYAFARF